ncbi:MAG: aminopeptidase P family protein [Ignavibacteriae bacterium]|nr:aminopeptidase P family protein [Ignavibacteriota bacterium]
MNLSAIQQALRDRKFDGWLLCDFHNRDHLAYRVLGLDITKMTTRRWFYYIPAKGEPRKLVHSVEPRKLDSLPGKKEVFLPWVQLHSSLKKMLGSPKKIAMQYSPKNNIPAVSLVDAGTIELVKSLGHKIVSSADLVQMFEATIDEQGYEMHKSAGVLVDRVRAEAFDQIRNAIATNSGLTEYQLQQFIMRRFEENGLVTVDPPIVGTNEHPADPHFESTPENARPFNMGDTVLIDMWAKLKKPGAIYYDITWVGYIGDAPSPKYQKLFDTVTKARDAAIAFVKDRFAKGKICYGWEVDDACRNVVKKAGYGKYFVHRTGHSIGEEVHGNGGNIDNLETKDERQLMPGCCFSIEPGIYLDGEMAVRSEINMFIRHDGVPEVTGEMQTELVKI